MGEAWRSERQMGGVVCVTEGCRLFLLAAVRREGGASRQMVQWFSIRVPSRGAGQVSFADPAGCPLVLGLACVGAGLDLGAASNTR